MNGNQSACLEIGLQATSAIQARSRAHLIFGIDFALWEPAKPGGVDGTTSLLRKKKGGDPYEK